MTYNDLNFIYYTQADKYVIGDVNAISESKRTFDIAFYALANNSDLLDKLHLYYMQGNYGVRYTYESRAEWFCGYLGALSQLQSTEYKKLMSNPMIRILILDNKLLNEIQTII